MYVTPADLSYDYSRRERGENGEDDEREGEENKNKHIQNQTK